MECITPPGRLSAALLDQFGKLRPRPAQLKYPLHIARAACYGLLP
jgi:hypothetical protein